MRTVSAAPVVANDERVEGLPESVLEALGELAGAAKEGLLALSVGVGLGVLHELMEAEVDEVVGTKGAATSLTAPRCGTATRAARRGHARRPARAGEPAACAHRRR
jgi:hypothetical protein